MGKLKEQAAMDAEAILSAGEDILALDQTINRIVKMITGSDCGGGGGGGGGSGGGGDAEQSKIVADPRDPAAPAAAKPPSYAATVQVSSDKILTVKESDLEAGLDGHALQVRDRARLRHKIIVLTLTGVSTVATFKDLGPSVGPGSPHRRHDMFSALDTSQPLKIAGAVYAVLWFALVAYAVIRDSNLLLRGTRFLQALITVMLCVMCLVAVVIQPMRVMFLVLAVILNACIIYSQTCLLQTMDAVK